MNLQAPIIESKIFVFDLGFFRKLITVKLIFFCLNNSETYLWNILLIVIEIFIFQCIYHFLKYILKETKG